MALATKEEKDEVAAVMRRWNAMKNDRVNWDSHWDEVSRFIIPKKDNIYGQNIKGGGEKKNQHILDATAIHSNELLASALHSMLTNPTTMWFNMSSGEPELDRQDDVRFWFQRVSQKMMATLNRSNFQTEVHELYLDLGSFGTGLMRIEEDNELDVRFHARPIYEAWIGENSKQLVDIVYRKFKWELRQIVHEFGMDALPDELKRDLDNNGQKGFKEYEILHCVQPVGNGELAAKKLTSLQGKPFESIYVLLECGRILHKNGFKEFPYVVPRWTKVSGETYGRSPGMKALPDIKMLNRVMADTIRAAQKATDPALQMPDDGAVLPIRTAPGSINYYRAGSKDRIEPLLTGSRPDIGFQFITDIRQRIRSAFFIDQLQLQEGPQMTATEVVQRTEEKLRLMGPILGRQLFEFMRPSLDRVFNIMSRKKRFPKPPAVLQGMNVDFVFTSQIVRAQQLSESQNFLRAIQAIAPIIEADPSALDNIDSDEALRYSLKLHGIPQEIIRSSDEIEGLRAQRVAAAQQAQQNEQELQDAEKVQKAGPTLLQASQG